MVFWRCVSNKIAKSFYVTLDANMVQNDYKNATSISDAVSWSRLNNAWNEMFWNYTMFLESILMPYFRKLESDLAKGKEDIRLEKRQLWVPPLQDYQEDV